MMANPLPLLCAIGANDRTHALLDGRVTIEGCRIQPHIGEPEALFLDAFHGARADVTELSLSSHAMTVAAGRNDYVAVPAFVSRAFRHSAIYVRAGSGIERPEQLAGQAIGVPEYQVTAAVWVRAMLARDHGVAVETVAWITGGVDEPGRVEKLPLALPPSIRVTPAAADETLTDMLLDDRIAALIAPRAPRGFVPDGAIRRLFDDGGAAARDYYRRSGLFPIMHLVGIRRVLAEAHPWLPRAVFRAFDRSRALGLEALLDTTVASAMLPMLIDEVDRTRGLMGDDFWSYGVGRNRAALDAFLGYHHEQGLSVRQLAPEDLFPASCQE